MSIIIDIDIENILLRTPEFILYTFLLIVLDVSLKKKSHIKYPQGAIPRITAFGSLNRRKRSKWYNQHCIRYAISFVAFQKPPTPLVNVSWWFVNRQLTVWRSISESYFLNMVSTSPLKLLKELSPPTYCWRRWSPPVRSHTALIKTRHVQNK